MKEEQKYVLARIKKEIEWYIWKSNRNLLEDEKEGKGNIDKIIA